ncbi:MAG: alpha/beta hydrolase fold domain-containing protein, partial [Roseburia sp.]|nr:alpha/beta hydrolase fold domain-containing protein [Roseburia sp.]
ERADCVTFNIAYSLAPDYPYPIPSTQIYEVLCYVHDHAEEFSVDAEKIMMAGDSAGGNLTAVCAQMDRDKGTCYLKAETLIYPKLIFSNYLLEGYQRDESAYVIAEEQKELLPGMIGLGSDESNAADEAVYAQGNYDITIPYISPAFGKKEGLPRTLLLLAEYDGLRLEGEFYAKQLKEAGVPVRVLRYRGVCHAFFDQLGILPQTEAALNEIVKLILQL